MFFYIIEHLDWSDPVPLPFQLFLHQSLLVSLCQKTLLLTCLPFGEAYGVSWLAKTPEAALKGNRNVVADIIKDMKENGEEIPQPIAIKHYSGKFMVRVPPEVHRSLAIQVADSGVSINRLVSTRLSR